MRIGYGLLTLALLLLSGACGRPWKFAQPTPRLASQSKVLEASSLAGDRAVAGPTKEVHQAVFGSRCQSAESHSAASNLVMRLPPTDCDTSEVIQTSGVWSETPDDSQCRHALEFENESCFSADSPIRHWRCRLRHFGGEVLCDHKNYYTWRTAKCLGLGVGAAAIFANTALDNDIQKWYQEDVRSSGTDDFSSFCKVFGEGKYAIPVCAGFALVGSACDQYPLGDVLGEFGSRATRGYLVGAPPMLFMQYFLGASRPGETSHGSYWKPFDDNNAVSGHSFVGAVPFITAAKMTDNRLMKAGYYFCSVLPAWSRINDDSHYFSQAFLGWWMAYLACEAIEDTEFVERGMCVSPVVSHDMFGMSLSFCR